MRFAKLMLALASMAAAQDQPAYTFGTTVVELSALEGRVYFLPKGTHKLPDFSHMSPAGILYTTMLNVWPQTSCTPAASAASHIVAHSSTESAIGFVHTTCFPCSAARMACGA